jgi:hypothetical protein
MNFSPYILILTSSAIVILFPLLNLVARKSATKSGLLGLYGYSVGLKIFLWTGTVAFALLPFVFVVFNVKLVAWQWISNEIVASLLAIGCVYTDRYAVQLSDCALTFGAFRKRSVMYRDITSATMKLSPRGGAYFVVKFSINGRVALDGNIQNFDDLVYKLKNKLGSINPSVLS